MKWDWFEVFAMVGPGSEELLVVVHARSMLMFFGAWCASCAFVEEGEGEISKRDVLFVWHARRRSHPMVLATAWPRTRPQAERSDA